MAYAAKVASKRAQDLEPGEQLLAAAKAGLEGYTKAAARQGMAGAMGGLVGVAVASALDKKNAAPATNVAPALPVEKGLHVLGVTDRRVMLWKTSKLTASPSELLASVPRSAVAASYWGESKVNGMKVGVLTVQLTDGRSVTLEIPRIHMSDGAAVHALLQTA